MSTKAKQVNLSILKIQIQSSVVVERSDFDHILKDNGINQEVSGLCPKRHDSDAVRISLQNILGGLKPLHHEGNTLRFIRCEAKTGSKTDIKFDIHLQCKSSDVEYLKVGSFEFDGKGVSWTDDPELPLDVRAKLPDELKNWCQAPQNLLYHGHKLFRSDLVRAAEQLLLNDLSRIWPGTFLVIDSETEKKALNVGRILEESARVQGTGKANVNLLTLQDSDENRKVLIGEMSDVFTQRAAVLIEELEEVFRNSASLEAAKLAKKVEGIREQYKEMFNEGMSIQSTLGLDFEDAFFDKQTELVALFSNYDEVESEKVKVAA